MAKPRHKYNVYVREEISWNPDRDFEPYYEKREQFVGSTWAASEAQAINNVRVREFGATHPTYWGDACDMVYLVAIRIDNDSPMIHDKFLRGE